MNDIARRGPLAALIVLPILAAISSSHPATVAASSRSACVPTAIHRGAPPKWTAAAWSASSPGIRLPYALASHAAAAAFFWTTLRAGHPTNPSNKVLWIVRYPRHGQPLRVLARLGASPSRTVRMSFPPDSSPGQIYPSDVDLPAPGCWHLTLRWDTHAASLNVTVHPAGATEGGGSTTASARSRPPEPLPRLTGPALATPTHMFIVASNNGVNPIVVNVDRETARAVAGLHVPSSQATLWGPRVELVRTTVGGVVALVSRQSCQRCALRQTEFLIASDGSVRRVAMLPTIVPSVTGTTETVPALGRAATWVLRWPRAGSCTLRLVPGAPPAVRVPCGDLVRDSGVGVILASGHGVPGERLVNPLTGGVRARVSGSLWPIHGDLVLENYGLAPGGPTGSQFGHLSLVNLRSGDRRGLAWPSYFGGLIRVALEPRGPLVAVDFGSPAYPGPAQAEDIWILDTTTGMFSHLPGYPARVDIKASSIAWTNDNRLVIVAQGGGRTVLAIWKPGQATLPLATLPNRFGYNAFIPVIG